MKGSDVSFCGEKSMSQLTVTSSASLSLDPGLTNVYLTDGWMDGRREGERERNRNELNEKKKRL